MIYVYFHVKFVLLFTRLRCGPSSMCMSKKVATLEVSILR